MLRAIAFGLLALAEAHAKAEGAGDGHLRHVAMAWALSQ